MKALKNNKGFTLIELLVVMAILAVFAVIAAGKISSKADEQNVSTFIEDFTEINAAMAKCGKIYRNDYTNCDFAELIRLGFLNVAEWGDGTGETPWNGDYSTAVVAGNTARFTISGDGISSDEYGAQLIETFRDSSVAVPTYDNGTSTFTSTFGSR